MLDTVKKQLQPYRLYQVRSAVPRLIPKELPKLFAQYLCTGFGITYNLVIERSSEYTVGGQQSSTKEGELYVYKLLFSPKYTCVLLKYF